VPGTFPTSWPDPVQAYPTGSLGGLEEYAISVGAFSAFSPSPVEMAIEQRQL